MARSRKLMQENVERVTRNSVSLAELARQRKALAATERRLAATQQRVSRVRERIAALRDTLAARRSERRQQRTPATARALTAATQRLETALQQREELLGQYRELKQLTRGQHALCRKLEKREEARQQAIAKFLRDWERNYDRELHMKEQNIERRKRQLQP